MIFGNPFRANQPPLYTYIDRVIGTSYLGEMGKFKYYSPRFIDTAPTYLLKRY